MISIRNLKILSQIGNKVILPDIFIQSIRTVLTYLNQDDFEWWKYPKVRYIYKFLSKKIDRDNLGLIEQDDLIQQLIMIWWKWSTRFSQVKIRRNHKIKLIVKPFTWSIGCWLSKQILSAQIPKDLLSNQEIEIPELSILLNKSIDLKPKERFILFKIIVNNSTSEDIAKLFRKRKQDILLEIKEIMKRLQEL